MEKLSPSIAAKFLAMEEHSLLPEHPPKECYGIMGLWLELVTPSKLSPDQAVELILSAAAKFSALSKEASLDPVLESKLAQYGFELSDSVFLDPMELMNSREKITEKLHRLSNMYKLGSAIGLPDFTFISELEGIFTPAELHLTLFMLIKSLNLKTEELKAAYECEIARKTKA